VKVEIHPNPHHLMPDPIETFEAARALAAEGFVVMPYMPADPVLASGWRRRMRVADAAGLPDRQRERLSTAGMLRLILRDARIL